ncbi:hypothetical protein MNBD_GAMMA15-1545 [hydrothermal vent metagenome]|uniref:Uncharacterized protein n=1 Tax=hydrothermal vent metagenome TaxID=652676 RepID=A0A3B0XW15_9ZZZZ
MPGKIRSIRTGRKTSANSRQTKTPDSSAPFMAVPLSNSPYLKELGLTDAGIRQLRMGQVISNRNDRVILARIVAEALK